MMETRTVYLGAVEQVHGYNNRGETVVLHLCDDGTKVWAVWSLRGACGCYGVPRVTAMAMLQEGGAA